MAKFLAAFVLVAIVLSATSALATEYECTTKRAFEWRDGELKPKPFWENTDIKNSRPYQPLLRFDDQSSTIWIASSDEVPFDPIPAEIKVPTPKGPENNDLVVVGKTTTKIPDGREVFREVTVLKIRGWKLDKNLKKTSVPLNFFFYDGSTNMIFTGGCVVTDK